MSKNARVLVVEDESALRDLIAHSLCDAGFLVDAAGDVATAQEQVREHLPDLIVLDWMLPDISGYEFLKHLRRRVATREVPVILVSAKGDELDRVNGLRAGADDYVAKPFSLRELTARVEAVLRRHLPKNTNRFNSGNLMLDIERHRVEANGCEIKLSPTEFRLLHFFMMHPERVYSRAQLLDNAWGYNVYIEERTVDVQIRRLRKTLEKHGLAACIQTVHGIGYRFSSNT